MRAVLQRVSAAKVTVDGVTIGEIGPGWLVLLGVGREDELKDALYLAEKTAQLRAFPDQDGKMNRSVLDTAGSILVVSQFTLFGDCRHGRRPGFAEAAHPTLANQLYEAFTEALRTRAIPVSTGQFQAHMKVTLTNDGPVTFLLDSRKDF